MAEIDASFEKQLEWEIEPQCFDTDTAAESIQREIEATRETWTPAESKLILEFSIILSCTRSVRLVGTKKPNPAVLKLVEVINNRPDPAELIAWRFKLPYKLRDIWNTEWAKGQDMFTVDPAQMSTNALTPAQREELKDKNSPLAEAE